MSKLSVFEIFENLEKVSSRNEMINILVEFYKSLDNTKQAQIYTYLLKGRVVPLFVNKEFNFSEKSALKVLENINDIKNLKLDVYKLRNEFGDAGLVAEFVVKSMGSKSSDFDIEEVYESLWKLIDIKGSSSVKAKADVFSNLIFKSSPKDAKFLTRIVSGKLRLGCSDKTILDAFSFLLVGDKSVRDVLDNAYGVVSDLGLVCDIVFSNIQLEEKLKKLEKASPIPGIPIFPRLVERVSSFEDARERFPNGGILQPKFDGLRCQIHKGVKYSDIYEKSIWIRYIEQEESDVGLFEKVEDEGIRLFSRNLNDITNMFPELVEEVKNISEGSFILDGEVVGWDEEKGYIPFQKTMSRRRKYGIVERVKSVPIKFFAFDLLSLEGKNLLSFDLEDRLGKLSTLSLSKGKFLGLTENTFFEDSGVGLEEMFERYIDEGLEGIILKNTKGCYLPGVRNFEWIKIKKSIGSKVVDTIDAVVLGYYYGSGKKTTFGVGSLLLGIYNSEGDIFETVGKLGTGFTDEEWKTVAKELKPLKLTQKSKNVKSNIEADVWVEPEIVLVVEADEISKSKVHVAGKSELGFGLSLRFPRLVSFGRDKIAKDCTSSLELVSMWKMSQKKNPQV